MDHCSGVLLIRSPDYCVSGLGGAVKVGVRAERSEQSQLLQLELQRHLWGTPYAPRVGRSEEAWRSYRPEVTASPSLSLFNFRHREAPQGCFLVSWQSLGYLMHYLYLTSKRRDNLDEFTSFREIDSLGAYGVHLIAIEVTLSWHGRGRD